jgi:very-short-patch-repair endonuclease
VTPRVQIDQPWWAAPPPRQVCYLAGADPELLAIALDPLPPASPVVVQFRPAPGGAVRDQIAALLDGMDRAAVALFPRWLPEAAHLDPSAELGGPAVRALAARTAARSSTFGPFLADLAERCLRDLAYRPSRFPAEVRASGLARVIADAYGRESSAVLIAVPDDLSPTDERALVAAAEWVADHGRLGVWFAGAPLGTVDRVRTVAITLPECVTDLVTDPDVANDPDEPEPERPSFRYPPLSGVPRSDSAAEMALERSLARHEWAHGRRWNHTFEYHLLRKAYRLDLYWPDERVVVEVDGPDHREKYKFADDRRRDVQLQLLGHDVLRFTNEEVLADVGAVVDKIAQLLRQRTTGPKQGDEAA